MKVLRNVGLWRRKPQPVGTKLEKGLSSRDTSGQIQWMYNGGILLALVLLTVAAFPRSNVYQYTVEVGEDWHGETVVAPFDFSIYKSEAELEAERTAIRENTPPFFQVSDDAQGVMEANRDTLIQQLDEVFDAWAAYRIHRLRGEMEEGEADSLRHLDLRRAARLKVTPEQWRLLADAYAMRVPELSGAEPQAGSFRPDERLLNQAWSIASQLLVVGVLDVPQDSVLADQIVVRDDANRTETIRAKDNTYGLDEAYAFAEQQFQQSEDSLSVEMGGAFFRAIFTPSLSYLRAETIRELQRLEQRISPVQGG